MSEIRFKIKKISRRLLGYLAQGLLYIGPVAILCYIVYRIFMFIDGIIPIDAKVPGLGILILLIIFTVLGYFASTIIARPLRYYFNSLLDRVPLIKTIYSSLKDLFSAFVGKDKKFGHPVLVKMNKDADLEKLGFLTEPDLHKLGIDNAKVAVYLPHSYNFSGNLYIVPQENVTKLDVPASVVMKFIVSGGISGIEELNEEEENTNQLKN